MGPPIPEIYLKSFTLPAAVRFSVCLEAGDFRRGRMHRHHGAGEIGQQQIVQNLGADLAGFAVGADHGDHARLEERAQAAGNSRLLHDFVQVFLDRLTA